MSSNYETVIGLEIHAQLLTQTKIFCRCPTNFGASDNQNTCPACTGMPGALPVLNHKAVEYSIRTGLALNCVINGKSVFARKNYFYPDLPKGYQISQYDQPLCGKGWVEFYMGEEKKRIGITRAHMEEDAGKSSHHGNYTLVNLNRSSMPLLEIVSEPDMRTPEEAAEYARTVRSILLYAGVCDGNLDEGSMRCDCNVSVRKKGETKFGTKVELKNINSFRFIEKAIHFEVERQIDLLESGEKVIQETRLYDPDKNRTFAMRTKEEAHDYRYFPEPDVLTLVVSEADVEKIRSKLPEMPVARAERFQAAYGLPKYDALILTQTKELADYFETVAKNVEQAKLASNWVMVELLAKLNEKNLTVDRSPVSSQQLSELIVLIEKGTLSGRLAKEVFEEMFETSKAPGKIVEEKGLSQITDTKALESLIDQVLTQNTKQLEEYRSGKEKLFGFFVGQAMKVSQGKASPDIVNQILIKKLKGN